MVGVHFRAHRRAAAHTAGGASAVARLTTCLRTRTAHLMSPHHTIPHHEEHKCGPLWVDSDWSALCQALCAVAMHHALRDAAKKVGWH